MDLDEPLVCEDCGDNFFDEFGGKFCHRCAFDNYDIKGGNDTCPEHWTGNENFEPKDS